MEKPWPAGRNRCFEALADESGERLYRSGALFRESAPERIGGVFGAVLAHGQLVDFGQIAGGLARHESEDAVEFLAAFQEAHEALRNSRSSLASRRRSAQARTRRSLRISRR